MNKHHRPCVKCSERQPGHGINQVIYCELNEDMCVEPRHLVRKVMTEKGQVFCNRTMETYYTTIGIVHTKVGPNAIAAQLVERTHKILYEW